MAPMTAHLHLNGPRIFVLRRYRHRGDGATPNFCVCHDADALVNVHTSPITASW